MFSPRDQTFTQYPTGGSSIESNLNIPNGDGRLDSSSGGSSSKKHLLPITQVSPLQVETIRHEGHGILSHKVLIQSSTAKMIHPFANESPFVQATPSNPSVIGETGGYSD